VEKEGSSGSGTEQSGVRRRRLLQIGGRAGKAEREMGGGGSARCRTEEGKWEREKGGAARGRQPDHEAGMAPGGAVGGGSARSRRRRIGEQGRAAGCGRCGATQLIGGVGRQRGGSFSKSLVMGLVILEKFEMNQ
jgi:hypothetical protein